MGLREEISTTGMTRSVAPLALTLDDARTCKQPNGSEVRR